jgi:hypothetical protein
MNHSIIYVDQYNSKVGPKFVATERGLGISTTIGPVGLNTENLRTVSGSRNAVLPGEWPNSSVRTWDDREAIDSLYEQPRARWGRD